MVTGIRSEPLRVLLGHYLEARGDKHMPARRDIDPLKLGPVLPIIWINEYEPAAGTFRYRLAGEEVNEVFTVRMTGRLLSDFVTQPERFKATNESFLKVIREEVALFASGPVYRCADRIGLGERLALPLSSDGVTADGIIGATHRETMVDLDKASMADQKVTFIPIDELASVQQRAVGD